MTDIDALIRQLEGSAGEVTTEVTSIRGHRGPKSGRLPGVTRAVAEAIRSDHRTIVALALAYDLSQDTIRRIKNIGRFKDVPYYPRDEYDRALPMNTATPTAGLQRGRSFKSGRPPLTDEQKWSIATDTRLDAEIAEDWGVSIPYIRQMRRDKGTTLLRRHDLNEAVMEHIRSSNDPIEHLAKRYAVSAQAIRFIRQGVTS